MKKTGTITVLVMLALAIGGFLVFRTISAKEIASAGVSREVSPKAAESLQLKIDAIKRANQARDRQPGASRVQLSEAELKSYVLFSLRDKIPAQLDSIDVQLGQDTVGSDTQMTFGSDSTGNSVVDAFISGTHNLFLKGKLVGEEGRGKFDLEEVRVDGIPVPKILIQTLVDKYVKPKYPEADLKEPFDLPWGIEDRKSVV